jgi:hypothetical protein
MMVGGAAVFCGCGARRRHTPLFSAGNLQLKRWRMPCNKMASLSS